MASYDALMSIKIDTSEANQGIKEVNRNLESIRSTSSSTSSSLKRLEGTFNRIERMMSSLDKTMKRVEKATTAMAVASFRMHNSFTGLTKSVDDVNKKLNKFTSDLSNISKKYQKVIDQNKKLTDQVKALQSASSGASSATDKLGKGLDDTAKSSRRLNDFIKENVQNIQKFILASIAFVGVGIAAYLIKVTDSLILMKNRLGTVNSEANALANSFKAVYNIAQSTRTSLAAVANLYARLGRNSVELRNNVNQLNTVVTAINQSFQLSGATAEEARNAIIQLSQAFASGRLQGDELRSMLELAPDAAKRLAGAMGISTGVMRKFAAEGLITTKVMVAAFTKAAPEIQKEFDKINGTIGQAFEVLKNAIIGVIEVNKEFENANQIAANSLEKMAITIKNIGKDIPILGNVLQVLAKRFDEILVFVGAIVAQLGALALGFVAFKLAALAALNPVVAVVGAVVVGLAALAAKTYEVAKNSTELESLVDVQKRISEATKDAQAQFNLYGEEIKNTEVYLKDVRNRMQEINIDIADMKKRVDGTTSSWRNLIATIKNGLNSIGKFFGGKGTLGDSLLGFIETPTEKLASLKSNLAALGNEETKLLKRREDLKRLQAKSIGRDYDKDIQEADPQKLLLDSLTTKSRATEARLKIIAEAARKQFDLAFKSPFEVNVIAAQGSLNKFAKDFTGDIVAAFDKYTPGAIPNIDPALYLRNAEVALKEIGPKIKTMIAENLGSGDGSLFDAEAMMKSIMDSKSLKDLISGKGTGTEPSPLLGKILEQVLRVKLKERFVTLLEDLRNYELQVQRILKTEENASKDGLDLLRNEAGLLKHKEVVSYRILGGTTNQLEVTKKLIDVETKFLINKKREDLRRQGIYLNENNQIFKNIKAQGEQKKRIEEQNLLLENQALILEKTNELRFSEANFTALETELALTKLGVSEYEKAERVQKEKDRIEREILKVQLLQKGVNKDQIEQQVNLLKQKQDMLIKEKQITAEIRLQQNLRNKEKNLQLTLTVAEEKQRLLRAKQADPIGVYLDELFGGKNRYDTQIANLERQKDRFMGLDVPADAIITNRKEGGVAGFSVDPKWLEKQTEEKKKQLALSQKIYDIEEKTYQLENQSMGSPKFSFDNWILDGLKDLGVFGLYGLQKYRGEQHSFSTGGMISGKSHKNGGVRGILKGQPIELEGGEYIINKQSVAKYGVPLFDLLNAKKFEPGGIAKSAGFKSYERGSYPLKTITADNIIIQNADVPKIEAQKADFGGQGLTRRIMIGSDNKIFGHNQNVFTPRESGTSHGLATLDKYRANDIVKLQEKQAKAQILADSIEGQGSLPENFLKLNKATEELIENQEDLNTELRPYKSGKKVSEFKQLSEQEMINQKIAAVTEANKDAKDWREVMNSVDKLDSSIGSLTDTMNTELLRLAGGRSKFTQVPGGTIASGDTIDDQLTAIERAGQGDDDDGWISKLIGGISSAIGFLLTGPQETATQTVQLIWQLLNQNEIFAKAREKFEKLFMKVFDGLASGLGYVLDAIYNAIYPLTPLFEMTAGFLRDALRTLTQILDPIYQVLDALTPVLVYINGAMQMIIGFLSIFIGAIADFLEDIFSDLFGMNTGDEWKSLNLLRSEAEILGQIENSLQGVVDILREIDDIIFEIMTSSLNLAAPTLKLETASEKYDELYNAATRITATEEDVNEFTAFAKEYLQFAQDVYKSSSVYQAIYEDVLTDLDDVKRKFSDQIGDDVTTVIRKAIYDLAVVGSDLDDYLRDLVGKYQDQIIGYTEFVDIVSFKLQQIEQDIDLKTFADYGQVSGSSISGLVESYGDYVERELERFNQSRKNAISASTLAEDLAYLYGVGVSQTGILEDSSFNTSTGPTIGSVSGSTGTFTKEEEKELTFGLLGGFDLGGILQGIIDAITGALTAIFETIGAAILSIWQPVEQAWKSIVKWFEEDFLTIDVAAEWATFADRFKLPDLATLDWSDAETNWQSLTSSLNLPDLQDLDWSDIQAWWSGDASQGIKGVTEKLNLPDLSDLDWSNLQDWWSGNEAKGIKGVTEQLNLPDLADLDWSDLQAWWSGDPANGVVGITEKLNLPDIATIDWSDDIAGFKTKLSNIWDDFVGAFSIDTSGWSLDIDWDILGDAVGALFRTPKRDGEPIKLFWNPFHQFGLGEQYLLYYKEGGLLNGPSHEQGGIKATVGQRRTNAVIPGMVELEGGEYIIRRSAVERYGTKFMDLVNREQLDREKPIQKFDNGGRVISDSSKGVYANSSPYQAYLQAKAAGVIIGDTRMSVGEMIANEKHDPTLLQDRQNGGTDSAAGRTIASLVYPAEYTDEIELLNAGVAMGSFGKDLMRLIGLPYGFYFDASFPEGLDAGLLYREGGIIPKYAGGGGVPVTDNYLDDPTVTGLSLGVSSTKTQEGADRGFRTSKGEAAWAAQISNALTKLVWGEQSNGINGILDYLGYAFTEVWSLGLRAVDFIGDTLFGEAPPDTYHRGYGPFGADIEPSYDSDLDELKFLDKPVGERQMELLLAYATHGAIAFLQAFYRQQLAAQAHTNTPGMAYDPSMAAFGKLWSLGTYDFFLEEYGSGAAAASTLIGPLLGYALIRAFGTREEQRTETTKDENTQFISYDELASKKYGGVISGGLAMGPSHESGMLGLQGDGSPFLFEGGEYIISKKSVNSIGIPYLDALNSTGKMPSYEFGGHVGDWIIAGIAAIVLLNTILDGGIKGSGDRDYYQDLEPKTPGGGDTDTIDKIIKELTVPDDRYTTIDRGAPDSEKPFTDYEHLTTIAPNITFDTGTNTWIEDNSPLSWSDPDIADKRYVQNILYKNSGFQSNPLNKEVMTYDIGQLFYGNYRREEGPLGTSVVYQTPADYMTGWLNNGVELLNNPFKESWKDIYLTSWFMAAEDSLFNNGSGAPTLYSAIDMMMDNQFKTSSPDEAPAIWSDYEKNYWNHGRFDPVRKHPSFSDALMYASLKYPGMKEGGLVPTSIFSTHKNSGQPSASDQPEDEKPKMSSPGDLLGTAAVLAGVFSMFDLMYQGSPTLSFGGYNPFFNKATGDFGAAAASGHVLQNYLANFATLSLGIAGLEALAVAGFNNPPMTPSYKSPQDEDSGGTTTTDDPASDVSDSYRTIMSLARMLTQEYSATYGEYSYENWINSLFEDVRGDKYRGSGFGLGLLGEIQNQAFHLDFLDLPKDIERGTYLFTLSSLFYALKFLNSERFDVFDKMFSGPDTLNNGVTYSRAIDHFLEMFGYAARDINKYDKNIQLGSSGWPEEEMFEFANGFAYGLYETIASNYDNGLWSYGSGGSTSGLAVGPSHQSGMLGMTRSGSPFLFEGGEYIINKNSAQKIGKSNLDRLNSYGAGGSIFAASENDKKDDPERRSLKALEWIEALASLAVAFGGASLVNAGTQNVARKKLINDPIEDLLLRGTAFAPAATNTARTNLPLGLLQIVGGTILGIAGLAHAFDLIMNGKPKEAEKTIIALKEGFEETPEEEFGSNAFSSELLNYYKSKAPQRERLDLMTAGDFRHRGGDDIFQNEKDWYFSWSGDGGFTGLSARMNPKEESILSELYGTPFKSSDAIAIDDLVVLNDRLKDLEHEVTIPDFFFPTISYDPITGEQVKELVLISGEKGTYRYNGTGPSDYMAPFTLDTFWTFYEDRLVRPMATSMLHPEGGYNDFINELVLTGAYNGNDLDILSYELNRKHKFNHRYQRFNTALNLPWINLIFSDHQSVGIGGIGGLVTDEEFVAYWNEFYEGKNDRGYHVVRGSNNMYGHWKDRSAFPNTYPEYGLEPYWEENQTFLFRDGWYPMQQNMYSVIYNKVRDSDNLDWSDLPRFWGRSGSGFTDESKLDFIPMVNWAMYDATISDWKADSSEFNYEWDEYGSGGFLSDTLKAITSNPLGALELFGYGYGAYQGSSMFTHGYKDVTGGAINVPTWMADYTGALTYDEGTSGLIKMLGGSLLTGLSLIMFAKKVSSLVEATKTEETSSSSSTPTGPRIDPDYFPLPPEIIPSGNELDLVSDLEDYYHSFDSASKFALDPLFASALSENIDSGMYSKNMSYVFSGETGFNSVISRMLPEEREAYEALIGGSLSSRKSIGLYDLLILNDSIKSGGETMTSDPFTVPGLPYLTKTLTEDSVYRGMGISDFINSFGIDTVWSHNSKDFASSAFLSFLYPSSTDSYSDFIADIIINGTGNKDDLINSKSNLVSSRYKYLNQMSRNGFYEFIESLSSTSLKNLFSEDYIDEYFKSAEELGLDRSVSFMKGGLQYTKNFGTRSIFEYGAGGKIPSYGSGGPLGLGGAFSDLFNLDFTERDNFIFDSIAFLSLMSGGHSALMGEGFASGFIGMGTTLGIASLATSGFEGSPLFDHLSNERSGESGTLINRDDESAKRNAILAAFGLTLLADQGMGQAIQNALFTGLLANTSPEDTRAGNIFSFPSANQQGASRQFMPDFVAIFDLLELFYYMAEGAVVNTKKNWEILQQEGAVTFLSNMGERLHNGTFYGEVENAIGGLLGWGQGKFIYENLYKKYASAREPYDPLFAYQLWEAGVLTQQQSKDFKFVWDAKKPFKSLGFLSFLLGTGDASTIGAITVLDTAHIFSDYVSTIPFSDPYDKSTEAGANYMGMGYRNRITGGPLGTTLWDVYSDLNSTGDFDTWPPGKLMAHEAAHYPQYLEYGGSGSELDRIQNFLRHYAGNVQHFESDARKKGDYKHYDYMKKPDSVGYTDYWSVLRAAAKHPTMFKRSGAGNSFSSGIDYLVWRLADGDERALRNWIAQEGGAELNESYAPFVQRGIKQFGQGGLAVGPSHQSGMLGMTKSGSPFLFEGGEYIINKKSTERLGTGFLNSLNSYESGGLTPIEEYYDSIGGKIVQFFYEVTDENTGEVIEVKADPAAGLMVAASFISPQPVNLNDMAPKYQAKFFSLVKAAVVEGMTIVEASKAIRIAEHEMENFSTALSVSIGALMGTYFGVPGLMEAGAPAAAYMGYRQGNASLPEGWTNDLSVGDAGGLNQKALGGMLYGPSHESGGVLLEAEGGEYVIRKEAVSRYGKGLLDSINNGTYAGKFPVGGTVPGYEDMLNMSGRKDVDWAAVNASSGGTGSGSSYYTGPGFAGMQLSTQSPLQTTPGVIGNQPGTAPMVKYGDFDYILDGMDVEGAPLNVFREIPAIGFSGGGGGGLLGGMQYFFMEGLKQILSNDLNQAITEVMEYPADTFRKWRNQYLGGADPVWTQDFEEAAQTLMEYPADTFRRWRDQYFPGTGGGIFDIDYEAEAEAFIREPYNTWKAWTEGYDFQESWNDEEWNSLTWANLNGMQALAGQFTGGLYNSFEQNVLNADTSEFEEKVKNEVQSVIDRFGQLVTSVAGQINSATGVLKEMNFGVIPNPLSEGRLGGVFGNLVPNSIKSRESLIDLKIKGKTFGEQSEEKEADEKANGGHLLYQSGGFALGPSHAQGGIPGIVAGKYPIEFEGGEYIINKKTVDTLGTGFFDYVNSIRAEDGFNTNLLFDSIYNSSIGFGSPISDILRNFNLPSRLDIELNAVTDPGYPFELGGNSLLGTDFPIFKINRNIGKDLARKLDLIRMMENGGAVKYAWGGKAPKFGGLFGSVSSAIGGAASYILTAVAPDIKAELGFGIPRGVYGSAGLSWSLADGGYLEDGGGVGGFFAEGGSPGFNSFGMSFISEVGSGSSLNASLLRELIYVLREKDLSVTFVDESGNEKDETSLKLKRMNEFNYRKAEELA